MALYLSRACLQGSSREVRRDLRDCYRMHLRLGGLFDAPRALPGQARVLYRVDGEVLLLQSPEPPQWSRLPDGYIAERSDGLGFGVAAATQRIDMALEQLQRGQHLAFILRGNPTQLPDGPRARGRRSILEDQGKVAWLQRCGDRGGFELVVVNGIPDVRVTIEPMTAGWKPTPSGRQRILRHTALFEGLLRVRDPEAFARSVARGVGGGGSWGAGLLSLARPSW